MIIKEWLSYLEIMKNNPLNRFAMATVIRVEGSAYRHERAKMLFGKNGEQYGTVSAWCLEEDLSYYAKEVISSQEPIKKGGKKMIKSIKEKIYLPVSDECIAFDVDTPADYE